MSSGEIKSAVRWSSITPNDSVDVEYRAIWVQSAGDIALRDMNDNDETFTVQDSTLLPLQPKRVLATGTTATGIKGLN